MARFFSPVCALALFLLLLPVFLIVSLFVWYELGRPIFFKQQRSGRFGEPFTIIKFRTMLDLKNRDGRLLPDELRSNRVGNFLRSTSLDELPELWNIFKGDMAFIGPRPLYVEYNSLYTPQQARRLLLRPGITGWAQVNGRNELPWEKKFELDIWYIENANFWLDLKILWLTVVKVIRREGINSKDGTAMPPFTGGNV